MWSRRTRHVAVVPDPAEGTGPCERQPAIDVVGKTAVVQLRDIRREQMLDDVRRQLDGALDEGPRSLIVDMSAVRESTSTTIAALLWIKRRCSERGVEPVLRRPSRRSTDVLRQVGLLAVLMVEATDGSSRAQSNHAHSGRE